MHGWYWNTCKYLKHLLYGYDPGTAWKGGPYGFLTHSHD